MKQGKIPGEIKGVCIWSTLSQTAAIPFALLAARFMSQMTEKAADGAVSTVAALALLLLALFVISGVFQAGMDIMIRRKQAGIMIRLRVAFMELVLSSPLNRLRRADYGKMNENLNDDLSIWAKRYTDGIPRMLSGAAGITGYTAYLLYRNPAAAGTLFIISLIQLLPPLIVKRYMQVNYDQCRELEARITDHIVEAVNGFETIKLYNLKQWWMKKMTGLQKEYLHVGNRAEAAAAAQRVMYRLLDHILRYGTCAIMGMYVLTGYCDFKTAVEGIVLSGSLFASVRQVFLEIPGIAVSRQAEKRLGGWKEGEEKVREKTGEEGAYGFCRENRYLLLGNNGAGKTTLLNLLGGLCPPDGDGILRERGILLGREGAERVSAEDYPQNISYVLQNDPAYDFDVRTLFSMLDEKTRAAACSIVKRLGLPREAMENVPIAFLSGGERKKVFLAVGFAAGSRWLLLDEPSNNLDIYGKEALLELVRERKGIIVVSHDPAFYQAADHVLRIEKGGLAEVW